MGNPSIPADSAHLAHITKILESETRRAIRKLPGIVFNQQVTAPEFWRWVVGWCVVVALPIVILAAASAFSMFDPLVIVCMYAPLAGVIWTFIIDPVRQARTFYKTGNIVTAAVAGTSFLICVSDTLPDSKEPNCIRCRDLESGQRTAQRWTPNIPWETLQDALFLSVELGRKGAQTIIVGVDRDGNRVYGRGTNDILLNWTTGSSTPLRDEVFGALIETFACAATRLNCYQADIRNFLLNAGSSVECGVSEELSGSGTGTEPRGDEPESESNNDWASLILTKNIKDQIRRRVSRFKNARGSNASGILLYGPPGTGKTLIARTIAKTEGLHFKAISPPDLKGPHIGQSEERTRAIWNEMRANSPSILFIDECEGVFSKRGSTTGDSFDEAIVRTFLSEWDGIAKESHVFVIGATNRHDVLDPAILSRFSQLIEIPLPDRIARRAILQVEFAKLGMSINIGDEVDDLTNGCSGRELARIADDVAAQVEDGRDFKAAFIKVAQDRRTGSSDAVDKTARWATLVLAEAKKNELKVIVEALKNAEILSKKNISVPRGLLLFGPPGTGKSQIARTIANESGLSFLAKSTSDIKGAYIGHSAKNVKNIFESARSMAPSVLCIDEIDMVAPARGGAGEADGFTREIVAQMLQEMDGVKANHGLVLVIGISNCPDAIDPAILSRLERQIEVPLPTFEERVTLLRHYLNGKPVADSVEDIVLKVAAETEGKSGRDLKAIVNKAESEALHRALVVNNDATSVAVELRDFV
jgi:SpoVK/Ycf46/Vps4 family AAA+-type ATPase